MRGRYMHPSGGSGKSGGQNFMGKSGGQSGLCSTMLTDPCPHMNDKMLADKAINAPTSHERVVATEGVVKPENIWRIFKESKHVDSRELARTKLKGLGYKV